MAKLFFFFVFFLFIYLLINLLLLPLKSYSALFSNSYDEVTCSSKFKWCIH